jgi:hypothetical protein
MLEEVRLPRPVSPARDLQRVGSPYMTEVYPILETAISDVGYWTWWAAKLPHTIQIEFEGVQLWNPPLRAEGPPSGQIALRFHAPSCIAFLRRDFRRGSDLPNDWYDKLHADEIGPFNVDHETFTLTSLERAAEVLRSANGVSLLHGSIPKFSDAAPSGTLAAFWAGPVGMLLIADSMRLFSQHGEIDFNEVESMYRKWWDYWREYWEKKDSDNPLRKDYACEVTIPLARGSS